MAAQAKMKSLGLKDEHELQSWFIKQMDDFLNGDSHSESFAEAGTYAPDPIVAVGPDEYLEHLRLIKSAVRIPVMASLNGVTPGGWISYARQLEEAGADGIDAESVEWTAHLAVLTSRSLLALCNNRHW